MCHLVNNKKEFIQFSFIGLLILISPLIYASQTFTSEPFVLNNKLYELEIADTKKRKRQGLMFRQHIGQNEGMLFKYKKAGDHRIWMKNTLIPLLVIWLDENANIIEKKILQPCRTVNCPVTSVSTASKYILELHPAETDRFKKGDQLPAIINSVKHD